MSQWWTIRLWALKVHLYSSLMCIFLHIYRETSCDIDFQNVIIFAGNDKDLHARAGVEDLSRGKWLEPGHGQTFVFCTGCWMYAASAFYATVVSLIIHIFIHRQIIIFNPAICKKQKIVKLYYTSICTLLIIISLPALIIN